MANNEVDIILKAVDQASAEIDNVNKSLGGTSSAASGVTASMMQLEGAVALVERGFGYAQQAIEQTVGLTVDYANEVRAVQQVTGASAEETSRLLQVLDDYKVSTAAVMAAQRTLTKDGIVLTTESLAELSKQYLAISGTAERNAFAQEKLGRNYKAFIEVLQQGPDAISRMSDAVSENLILTQDAVDAAREYEKALDDWVDTIDGVKIAIGTGILPSLTNLIKATKMSVDEQGIFKTGITDIIYYFNQVSIPVDSATRSYTAWARALSDGKPAVEDAIDDTDALAKANAETTRQYQGLLDATVKIDDATQNYNDQMASLQEQSAAVQGEIDNLLKQGWWPMSDKVTDLKNKQAELGDKMLETSEKFRQATDQMVLDMVRQQLAADGVFDSLDFQRYLDAAVAMGTMDAASAELAAAQQELSARFADGRLSAEQLKSALDMLAQKKYSVDVIMNILTNAGIRANLTAGESFRDQYQYRATGGEAQGWTIAGEQGPELIDLRGGGRVNTAAQTRGMFGDSGPVMLDPSTIDALSRAIASAVMQAG